MFKKFNFVLQLFALPAFESSQRISIYLSTEDEISTIGILQQIFKQNKLCFVPRYSHFRPLHLSFQHLGRSRIICRYQGEIMEMVKLESMEDYEKLPLTKWNIKQPGLKEKRENALETGGCCN